MPHRYVPNEERFIRENLLTHGKNNQHSSRVMTYSYPDALNSALQYLHSQLVWPRRQASSPFISHERILCLTRRVGCQHFSPPPMSSYRGWIPGKCSQEVRSSLPSPSPYWENEDATAGPQVPSLPLAWWSEVPHWERQAKETRATACTQPLEEWLRDFA